ncbi:MAG: hypothetical protein ACKVOU_03375 [Cytophagales bacterium]
MLINKKSKSNISPLQPPTLAPIKAWGSSAGAGSTDLHVQSYTKI